MTIGTKKLSGTKRAALLLALVALPTLAAAVETDRLTVEDPSTGAIKFKVTSEGNVTAANYAGDGSALTNVPHWKGTWSAATAYAKDDCVYYGGSSYIALAASTGAQPDSSPASWYVLAAQGPAGAAGATGAQGPVGPAGPAGSPDTQAQILGKVATQTDGAVLGLQQGPTEAATAAKLNVMDKTGVSKFSVSPQVVKIGDPNATIPPIEVSGGAAGSDIILFKRTVGTNLTFGLSLAGGGITFSNKTAGTSNLFLTTYSGVPTMVVGLDNYAGAGRDGWIRPGGANINSTTNTAGSSLILSSSPQTGTGARGEVRFQTYPAGVSGTQWTTPVTRVKVKPDGELEVFNGIKFSTATKPTCDATTRGTFWFSQGASGAKDVVEACAKDATDGYAWRQLW